MTDAHPVDVDTLPPIQYLIVEVLAARHRLGEPHWPFPNKLARHLKALADTGLIGWQNNVAPLTARARLTDAGRDALLTAEYQLPTERARTTERERIARYLERAASDMYRKAEKAISAIGSISNQASTKTLTEAARWCRDNNIWKKQW